jgi:hypothetical protein
MVRNWVSKELKSATTSCGTPSGAALVIDANAGKKKLSDADIDKPFVAQKK